MRHRQFIFIAVLALVLILAGCAKVECRKDEQCVKQHYTAKCVDNKCAYTPIPGECGNGACEGKENSCTCPQDCAPCAGKLGKYLVKQCNAQKECTADIPASAQKPITLTREITTGGTKIGVTSTFNQPFNLKRDELELEFGINAMAAGMSDLRITRLALTGTTADRRTVQLADKTVTRPLFDGAKSKEYLTLDFSTAEHDGELANLNLNIYLDYVQSSGTSSTPKSATIPLSYQSLKFDWARPDQPTGCGVCDDGNPATIDTCGPETEYYCVHTPKPGVCGSGVCDGGKNKCTCPQDCGTCTGSGTYTTRACIGTSCLTELKPGITAQQKAEFDDRDLSAFHLQNNYKYAKPFNAKTDKFTLEFMLYQKQDTVDSVKIKDIRLLDGTEEIAHIDAGKTLTAAGQKETVQLTVPPQTTPEQERNIILRVWYEYVQSNQTKQADYTKSLGKITLVSPDV